MRDLMFLSDLLVVVVGACACDWVAMNGLLVEGMSGIGKNDCWVE